MKLYMDGESCLKTQTIADIVQLMWKMKDEIHKSLTDRAGTKKILWVDGVNDGNTSWNWREICEAIKKSSQGTGVNGNYISQLKNLMFVLFDYNPQQGKSAKELASHEGSLVVSLHSGKSAKEDCVDDLVGKDREFVWVSDRQNLKAKSVCRVLYCNNPDCDDNKANFGYNVVKYHKHSKKTKQKPKTKKRKDRKYNAQFDREYCYPTEGYNELIRLAVKKAMQDGHYSEGSIDGYCYTHSKRVGQTRGEKTHSIKETSSIYVDFNSGNIHIYPWKSDE